MEAIEHPPHIHRLLRLVREGTPSHASRASVLLGRYAASCVAGAARVDDDDDGDVGGGACGAGAEDDGRNDEGCGVVGGDEKRPPHPPSVDPPAASASPSLVIWDLIGRLVGGDECVDGDANRAKERGRGTKRKSGRSEDRRRPTSGLFDRDWSTRANSALALECVAKCLPLEDRRHFFEGGYDDDEASTSSSGGHGKLEDGDEGGASRADGRDGSAHNEGEDGNNSETLLWLNVHDLQKQCNGGIDEGSDVKMEGGGQQPTPNQLEVVSQQGRLLLSSSGIQYDWDCDDEANEYIREQEALRTLDSEATTSAGHERQSLDGDTKAELQRTFLMRRVKLQRQILARRLGLGGILSAPIVADSIPSSEARGRSVVEAMVDDEDLTSMPPPLRAAKAKPAKRPKKRQRRGKKSSKPKAEGDDRSVSIRALLVLETERTAVEGVDAGGGRNRHRNPQTLLGSELAYRTFDGDWTVRHGALLGTLALLRAWRVHDAPGQRRQGSGRRRGGRSFGKWPHDILARCVCVLALDQFADFSGSSCGGGDGADVIASGAIVAPVRETAAQIVAILSEASPPEVADCTHDLLMQMYTRTCNGASGQMGYNGWDRRFGVLLAWKYMCAMALFFSQGKTRPQRRTTLTINMANDITTLRPLSTAKISSDEGGSEDESRVSTFNGIIMQSIAGLSDSSDDNRAAAAQVLRHSLLIDDSMYSIDTAHEVSKPLWKAIMTIREGVSSCAADILHLLAELLSRDCSSFLSRLHDVLGSLSFERIVEKLVGFIHDDSVQMKISSFCALRLVLGPITTTITHTMNPNGQDRIRTVNDCCTTLCNLLNQLFETFFIPAYICSGDVAGEEETTLLLSKSRDQLWSAILNTIATLAESTDDHLSDVVINTFNALTLRYLGISYPAKEITDGKGSESRYTRINEIFGRRCLTNDHGFISMLAAANAISQLYEAMHFNGYNLRLSDALLAIMQSPWDTQCEAACILYMSMTSLSKPDDDHNSMLRQLIGTFENVPTCIVLQDNSNTNAILESADVQSLCDRGVVRLLSHPTTCSSEETVQVWSEIFRQRGVSFVDLRKSGEISQTTGSMRILANISGCIVSCGAKNLPQKVSPLIRALVTSLKNEESLPRRRVTCRHIAKIIPFLSENPTHEKARTKLVENVCTFACSEDDEQPGQSTGAQYIIELLVERMSSTSTLLDYSPIWNRLAPLLYEGSSDITGGHLFHNAIFMLEIISRAITNPQSPSFKCVLDSYVQPLVRIACANSQSLQARAFLAIKNFCRVDFCATMDRVLPSLLPILNSLQDDRGREGGCKLLSCILRDFEVMATPYVKALLPVCMRLMTDAQEECSQLAASTFAILVRIAPLAASHICNDDGPAYSETETDHIVRHLILGKPLPPCNVPSHLLTELKEGGTALRPYQMEGISWLNFLAGLRLNGALCDDMGLGKTLQALVAVAISHQENEPSENSTKSLVICPSSVVGHWMGEIQRFFPRGKIFSSLNFTGSAKSRRKAWHDSIRKCNIIITSYNVLRSDINLIESTLWDYCILDEGHLLKNPKTSTAKASRRLKARHRLIMTGTPIQNNVNEIWATFDFLMPNFLGTSSSFLAEFAKPVLKSQAPDASASDIYSGMESLKVLHQQVLPFVLRREKSQVIKELPPKIITDIPCSLSLQQSVMYQRTLKQSGTKEALEMVDDALGGIEGSLDSTDEKSKKLLGNRVLVSLMQLRLICTHPLLHSLFSQRNDTALTSFAKTALTRLDCSGKLSALNDLLRHAGIAQPEITAADNDESGFLTDIYEDTHDSSMDELEQDINDPVDDIQGSTPPELLSTGGSKCLIFAQFTQSLDIVERLLFEPHMPSLQYLRLDGRIPCNKRSSVVERFNQDDDIKVLLLTTKVGGLGLNLTGADKVIFLEPDWNPFVDLQAMDRCHRIGQTKTVNVYRLFTLGTIEEKMMKIQQRKKATSEAIVNSDNSTMFSMGTDRLLDIFSCRGESTTAASMRPDGMRDDNVLSYLDGDKPNEEYAGLTVNGFMRGL